MNPFFSFIPQTKLLHFGKYPLMMSLKQQPKTQLSYLISLFQAELKMIAHNIEILKSKISKSAKECGRPIDSVKLVAVSKRFPASVIKEAHLGGQLLFGENYIQEACQKYEELQEETTADLKFHFIGHLQSNKTKIAAQIFSMIETVDSVKLAVNLNKHLTKLEKTLNILIQVNIGGDDKKSGVAPEQTKGLLLEISKLPMLRPLGLMTIPPFTENPEEARPFFRDLRMLAESLQTENLFYNNDKVELSMGMSDDYHVAIEEGATLVRIGTAIFGQRTPKP